VDPDSRKRNVGSKLAEDGTVGGLTSSAGVVAMPSDWCGGLSTGVGSAFGIIDERLSSDDFVENVQAFWKIASQEKESDEDEPDSAGASGVDGSAQVAAAV
jgi:hypothetical protein